MSIQSPLEVSHSGLSGESEHRWKRFAMMVAHDLKEPIRNIGSCARMLGSLESGSEALGVDEHQVRRWLMDSADRLESMIDSLVQHAKNGGEDFVKGVQVGQVIDDICRDFRCLLRRTGGSVACETEMPAIEAGPLGVRAVFQNLIENGLKYAKPGERPVVRLSAEKVGSGWMFRCRDEGKGMSAAQAEVAFEPFRRFDHDRDGMGMGLHHVRQIIEAHGGAIWAESVLGEGTTMVFTLPESQPA